MDKTKPLSDDRFHNPYNFIPAPPVVKTATGLEQKCPVGHHAYFDDHYSGSIKVTIEAISPMLLPDTRRPVNDEDHLTFDMHTDDDYHPILKATSLRGALRSAYEAVTNSRMGVFDNARKLGRRMAPKDGLSLVPARVDESGENLELYQGFESDDKAICAAGLPYYQPNKSNKVPKNRLLLEGESKAPVHGQRVACLIEAGKRGKCWKVKKIADIANKSFLTKYQSSSMRYVEGYVCITNQNIGKKRNERVFFTAEGKAPDSYPLTNNLREDWKALIEDYAEKNSARCERRDKPYDRFLNDNEPAVSRQIINADKEKHLPPGTLCYARFNEHEEIEALFPVMISRELSEVAPEHLLPDCIKPAKNIYDLSPADRVFGWVRQNKREGEGSGERGAYKGQLRIRCVTAGDRQIESFGDGNALPLSILASPKTEQFLFYGALDKRGMAPANGQSGGSKDIVYKQGRGLRGRKVYPHQERPEGYWQVSQNWDAEKAGKQFVSSGRNIYREFLQACNPRTSNQNRSVTGWVAPGTKFKAELEVTNLTKEELGALLYILDFDNGYHKLGAAKPLGFGSVSIRVAELSVRSGQEIREGYKKLSFARLVQNKCPKDDFIKAYKTSIQKAYKAGSFESVSFIRAFEAYMTGYSGPVHYPRPGGAGVPPKEEAQIFKWFVENKRRGMSRNKNEKFAWLDALGHETAGLPYFENKKTRR